MARKNVLYSYKMFDSETVSADAYSSSTDVTNQDYCSIDFSWSANTLVAVLYVQVKNGEKGDWRSIDFGTPISISGSSGSHEITITDMPWTNMRLFIDKSSGTSGVFNAIITSKSKGA